MSNRIEICNRAIARIGANTIQSLDEATREAEACTVLYEAARDATLQEYDFNFARAQVVLTPVSETRTGYSYLYQMPSNCLVFREIYNASRVHDEEILDFDLGISTDGNSQLILTNVYQAEGIYTKRITNESVFPENFADALSWRLAAELAVPLRAESQLENSFYQTYKRAIAAVSQISGNSQHKTRNESSSLRDARS